jgi:hypothetical protein
MSGPTKEEVWNNIGRSFFDLEKAPETADDFLKFIFENGETQHETELKGFELYRWKYNNRAMFFYYGNDNLLFIYDKVYYILNDYYDLTMEAIWNKIKEPLQTLFCEFTIDPKNIRLLED